MSKIIFMDGFDSVRDYETQSKEIFSTILPTDLAELLNRKAIPTDVVDNVVVIFNQGDLVDVDNYLLDEASITQDEREIIVEAIFNFLNPTS